MTYMNKKRDFALTLNYVNCQESIWILQDIYWNFETKLKQGKPRNK